MDRAGWAPAECGNLVSFPPGQIPLVQGRSSSVLNIYPSLLPSSQKSLLRCDLQGSASAEPRLVPAVGKRLRASVSPSCRAGSVLPPHSLEHLQTDALCC